MDRTIVSSCHSLRLIPLGRIKRFARLKSKVILLTLGEAEDAEAIPGSLKVAMTSDNGLIKTQITFERSNVSPLVADALEDYKALHLVATYVDENGRARVAGSPLWPLSLDYICEDGVFSVTLDGSDIRTHAFLAD